MTAASSENVSPTAFATGYFWYRHGLSHPALATPRGKRLDRMFRFMMGAIRATSGVSLPAMMLARHRGIDAVLTHAIESGHVRQVIELAAGLSGRGLRFMQRYGDRLTYVETDLPHMVELKQQLLGNAGLLSSQHRVVPLNALAPDGPASLAAVAAKLNLNAGTAIITEGLMSYLEPDSARALWQRIARVLGRFPRGVYLSDLYLRQEVRSGSMLAFRTIIQRFVRGKMHTHFDTTGDAQRGLKEAGFAHVTLHEARALPELKDLATTRGADRVRVLEASLP